MYLKRDFTLDELYNFILISSDNLSLQMQVVKGAGSTNSTIREMLNHPCLFNNFSMPCLNENITAAMFLQPHVFE